MNSLVVLVGTIFLASCMSTRYIVNGDRSIYIQTSAQNVTAHCSPEHPEDKNSFAYIYVVGESRVDQFLYRRPWPYRVCLESKKEMEGILKNNSIVRVAGINGDEIEGFSDEPDDEGNLLLFKKGAKTYNWIFERIEGRESCKGYFESSCDGEVPFRQYGSKFEVKF